MAENGQNSEKRDTPQRHSSIEMDSNRVRKNYGGRMIFGDEKLTPLRSVPRCALLLSVVGAYNKEYTVQGSVRPSPKCSASQWSSTTVPPQITHLFGPDVLRGASGSAGGCDRPLAYHQPYQEYSAPMPLLVY